MLFDIRKVTCDFEIETLSVSFSDNHVLCTFERTTTYKCVLRSRDPDGGGGVKWRSLLVDES